MTFAGTGRGYKHTMDKKKGKKDDKCPLANYANFARQQQKAVYTSSKVEIIQLTPAWKICRFYLKKEIFQGFVVCLENRAIFLCLSFCC